MSDGDLELEVVTGLSGSGISTAIHALEDLGFFCVDNLPPPLLPKLIDLARDSPRIAKLAIGLDARNVRDARPTLEMLENLTHVSRRIIFLEASDSVLLRRFSVSRRRHPLSRDGLPLPDAILKVRQAMLAFRDAAQRVVDTSDLNVHECKRVVQHFAAGGPPQGLALTVLSFGFRHGVPTHADVVWDVRFLPNPHFIDDLRPFSGRDEPVRDYVLSQPPTQRFLKHFLPLLDEVLPAYEHEGKSYLTVGIGCTGGRHRSVAIAEAVAEHLQSLGLTPTIDHRDVERGS